MPLTWVHAHIGIRQRKEITAQSPLPEPHTALCMALNILLHVTWLCKRAKRLMRRPAVTMMPPIASKAQQHVTWRWAAQPDVEHGSPWGPRKNAHCGWQRLCEKLVTQAAVNLSPCCIMMLPRQLLIRGMVQDVVRRWKETHDTFNQFAEKVAFQLNDTHPTIAVPELMRVLMDENQLSWAQAWDITSKVSRAPAHCLHPAILSIPQLGLASIHEACPRVAICTIQSAPNIVPF